MKWCKGCSTEKTVAEFVKHKRYADGLYCYCKECVKAKNKAYKPTEDAKKRRQQGKVIYRASNRRRIREQDRTRYRLDPNKYRERAKIAQKKYYNSAKGKEKYRIQGQLVIKRFPEKNSARTKVYAALKKGRLKRPIQCSICKKSCKPEAHHSDYSRPLKVLWVCRTCHMMLHRRISETQKEK